MQDYGVIEPGADATAALRHIASEVPTIESGRATFRITGQIALADQQFASLTEGIVTVTVISVLLILLWLVLAVRRLRYILAIVLTLILGLLLTTFFASLAIGTLNLISVAFAVLFVGLAIDFAIQICVRYRDERRLSPRCRDGAGANAAQDRELRSARGGVDCRRLLRLRAHKLQRRRRAWAHRGRRDADRLRLHDHLPPGADHLAAAAGPKAMKPASWDWRRWTGCCAGSTVRVLGLFAVLAIAGVVLLPRITFDSDPLDTQNPHTEAMETLRALASNPVTNPYSIDVLSPSVAAAAGLAAKLSLLPMVDHAISLSSFVPADQSAKLDAIADTEELLAPTLNPGPASPVTPGDIRIAATTAEKAIDSARAKLAPGSPLLAIGADLATLGRESDSQLMAANAALTEFLPVELDNLRSSLSAGPVTLANLPRNLTIDWLTPDGRARVQVLPKASAMNSQGLRSFVNEVTAVAPGAGGISRHRDRQRNNDHRRLPGGLPCSLWWRSRQCC